MELIKQICVCTLTVSILAYLAAGEAIKDKLYTVERDMHVTNVYKTLSVVFSLSSCSQFCLADDKCVAVTFQSELRQCQLSETVDTTTCALTDDCGTLIWVEKVLATCPAGVEFCNRDAQVYYEFVDSGNTWLGGETYDDARAACQNNGGQLAVLDTDVKIQWMIELREAQVSNSLIHGQRFWIGLTLQDGVGTWVNGETLTDSDWYTGSPGGSGSQCVESWDSSRQWQWIDTGCTNTKHYICEYSF